jgi:hypothetical protein
MQNGKFLIFLCVFLLFAGIAKAQPKLVVVGGDTVSWGKVRLDESPVRKKLIFLNAGDKDLIFRRVMPSCGCTTAPLNKDTLAPGDTAIMDITFNLPNHRGRARKAIQILTNDPKQREKFVYLFADVIFPLDFFPGQNFIFTGLVVGDTMTSKVVITNTTDEDIVVKQVKISPSFCTTDLKDDMVIKAKGDLTVSVTAAPPALGNFIGQLEFKTTHPDVVRVKIPVIMNIVGEKRQKERIPKY